MEPKLKIDVITVVVMTAVAAIVWLVVQTYFVS